MSSDSDGSPPLKRKRGDNSDLRGPTQNPEVGMTRGGIWFEDGNVVLIAESTSFKVHRGVLSHNSDIFRDMFQLPQPTNLCDLEVQDGLQVVRLPDSLEDTAHMLSALYNGQSYFTTGLPISLSAVSSMLRLGTKYNIIHLRQEAIRRLKRCFPSSLIHFRNKSVAPNGKGDNFDLTDSIRLSIQDSIVIVNLAREFDLDFVLPPAFYLCAQLPFDSLTDGVPQDDETIARLSPADLKTVLHGTVALRDVYLRNLEGLFLSKHGPSCRTTELCNIAILRVLRALWTDASLARVDVFTAPVQIETLGRATEPLLCSSCLKLFKNDHTQKRLRAWDELGNIFSVDGWPIDSP